jgi:serine/threonine-protein kinase
MEDPAQDDDSSRDTVRSQVSQDAATEMATPSTPRGDTPAESPRARRPRPSYVPQNLGLERYQLGALLGQGGMGEVVLAVDEQIGREVAIKRIRSQSPSPEALARFVREARVQGRLEHPAVVPVHDLAIDRDGRPFFVMKRLTGTTMADLLGRMRTDDDAETVRRRLLRTFADVCLAVEFAHSRGIVHRDLKPANIMLGDFGEVYVLDWGVARAVAEADDSSPHVSRESDLQLDTGQTQVGTVLGTPAYMAPEQMIGERAGPAADIYALGCILYEILVGEPLHRAGRPLAMAGHQELPTQARPESPPELDPVCQRATELDAGERYPTARALGAAVQDYLDGDRDVALRRELAASHLLEARAALARGVDEEHRRDAMRAAGRALSLDPTATEAAELVTRLVLDPPAHLPAAVKEQISRVDTDTAREQGRLSVLSMYGYLAFVPLMLWSGVRSNLWVGAIAALAMGSALQLHVLIRRDKIPTRGLYLNVCINALLIGVICRVVGPFIIAPTLVTTTLMAYAIHPQLGRVGIIAPILGSAVAVPWALELTGVLPPTYEFVEGSLVLHSSALTFSAVPVQLAFALLLLALLTVVAVLSRRVAGKQRQATERLELQAWHLRQLVPTSQTR